MWRGCWSPLPRLALSLWGPCRIPRCWTNHHGQCWCKALWVSVRAVSPVIFPPGCLMPGKQMSPHPQRKKTKWIGSPTWSQASPLLILLPSLHPLQYSPHLTFCVSVSQGSAGVSPRCLPRTFIRETALLIKELIFSLLSPISIVNLKHCEFFKFSSLLSKRTKEEEKRWEWGDI